MKTYSSFGLLIFGCIAATLATARVGETKEELVHRYGEAQGRQSAQKSAQGRSYIYGEYLQYRSEDWRINALIINGRCEEVTYTKKGEWTEAQIKHLLEVNGGRAQWEEQPKPRPSAPRQWKRKDRVMATWTGGGLEIKSPVVEYTRDAIAKKAKEEASKLPKF